MSNYRRHSLRLQDYDYTQEGAYFLTLCAADHASLFGVVNGDHIDLSGSGRIVQEEWLRTAEVRTEIVLDEFVVMPNHFHGIVFITYGDQLPVSYPNRAHSRAPLQRPARSLGSLVAQFKAVVTTRVRKEFHSPRQHVWQRNYHEHIIRNPRELSQIRKYIRENPLKWHLDEYFRNE